MLITNIDESYQKLTPTTRENSHKPLLLGLKKWSRFWVWWQKK